MVWIKSNLKVIPSKTIKTDTVTFTYFILLNIFSKTEETRSIKNKILEIYTKIFIDKMIGCL